MRRTLLSLILGLFIISISNAQVDHWEMIFDPGISTNYYADTASLTSDWNTLAYVPGASWKTGICAIGYGPSINTCSICTKIPSPNTIYARTKFTVADTADIASLVLYIDYSDGIVAYINGVEVARENLGLPGSPTTPKQKADATHLLGSYTNEAYTGLTISKEMMDSAVHNGENVLCVELHNDAVQVNDEMFYAYLYAGMKNPGSVYNISYPFFPFPAQIDSTKLPIVLLDVPAGIIPDYPRTPATMKIIDHGGINHPNDLNYSFKGNISIERRGSASQMFSKHSYGFSTVDHAGADSNVSLLGLPKENDWILKGEMEDRSLIRDKLTYQLARDMGRYAPRSEFCELYINGIDMGLFEIEEKIKRDSCRVDIAKLKETDNADLDVTGGYILKIDKTTGTSSPGFSLKYAAPVQGMYPLVQYDYPKGDVISEPQKTYIQNFIYDMEDALRKPDFTDPVTGYRSFISVKSFIDYMISQELARNVDGYRLSTFFYKEKDKTDKPGQLHMGPLWDFNLAYGYSGILCSGIWAGEGYEGWCYDYNTECQNDSYYIPYWWDRLLQDPDFRTKLKARWDELRVGPLQKDSIMNYIDSTVAKNLPGINNNYLIWDDVFHSGIWPNDPIGNNYSEEITYLKNFISNRLNWLDAHIPEVHEVIIYTSVPSLTAEIRQIRVYPVPFRDMVTFDYNATDNATVSLSVYNLNGQLIHSEESNTIAGQNFITWNGTDNSGNLVESGMYIYTLEMQNNVIARGKITKY
jgi:hypothetical protein